MVTARQAKILCRIVDEYINTASPVSSGAIFELENFGISCPTIRNEMADLTEGGYLVQPHTSAGRVPTEQGYRFFVNSLTGRKYLRIETKSSKRSETSSESALKFLSDYAEDAILAIDSRRNVRYAGLKKVFSNPEFQTHEAVISLFDEFENIENSMDKIFAELEREIGIFIGSENTFFESDDFSMITSPCKDGFIVLIGPMRMDYRRNISLLRKLYE